MNKREKEGSSMPERKYKFERLTPIDNMDLDVYEDALNYVFENSDIKNVAISGAYSAGKSSVLASYKKKHEKLRFLHISLAHFQSPNEKDEIEVKQSILEGKILNQLIHQIPSNKIPLTNFKVKKRISGRCIAVKTLAVVVFLIATMHFVYFNIWKAYVSTLLADWRIHANWLKIIIELSTDPLTLMVDGSILIVLFGFFIYRLIQKNKNVFRKLNLQGNEIEIMEESDDSYFDKYLNEVLYLFENADADAIVFEDMDRFNVNGIFEHLREVNTLANIQLQKENKKILRFFYLLRDDIFVSKDRTKFFDYIIPVVPVIDGSNSYDQFVSHFKKSGLFQKFDEGFLQGLSLYIDDMRLLKNIYNEFVIYFNRLNITELDCNKMLAIIAYKNLFPRDFSDLQLNKGFVYTIFDSKDLFIEKEIKRLKEKIAEKSHEIEMAKNEHFKTIHELDVYFDTKKTSDYWNSRKKLSSEDQTEYTNRKKALEQRLNNTISQMEDEKSALDQELLFLKNKQLKDIIKRENVDSIFSVTSINEIGKVTDFNEIKSSEYFDLLKYLIRNGYIDETYADYMTYFYENSLSRIDKIFLRSITDKKAKEYSYKLKNPQMVVLRLRLVDFDQEEILNFSLLTYLLNTKTHADYLEKFINQLKATNNYKFVGQYFDVASDRNEYVKCLNLKWPELFCTALDKQALTKKQIRQYSIASLYYSDENTIKLVNKDNCLCDYISRSSDYLAIDEPDINKLIHGFKLLGVCFENFDYEILNKDLFHAVYQESLYEISAENLKLIQGNILNISNDDIAHKNYTCLLSYPDSAITQYVNHNINEYFVVILQMCGGIIFDDEKTVISVLNNPELMVEHKCAYISALQTTITFISDVTDHTLWEDLLEADIVKYSERNIIDEFNILELSQGVISYINRCDIQFDFSGFKDEESCKEKLFEGVVRCGDIVNSKYKQVLVALGFYYDDFEILNIPLEKVTILIDADIIKMTAKNLIFLRQYYSDLKLYFICKNIVEYVSIMSNDLFSQEELLEILTWDIEENLKIELLKFSSCAISVIGKNYSPKICLYILDNNFENSDLVSLFSTYEQWEDSIRTKIFDYALSNMEVIIKNSANVSEKLKNSLLHSSKLNGSMKIYLFSAMIPMLCIDQIKEILNVLNLTNFNKIFDEHSRPRFDISDENKRLLMAFKEKGLIANYEEAQGNSRYYKVIRKKLEKKNSIS